MKSGDIKHGPEKQRICMKFILRKREPTRIRPQNIRRRNERENNRRKYEQGQADVHDTRRNDGRPKKKCKYTLRSHARAKQTSHLPVLNKKNQQRESV